jgi:hypothetical protein
MGWKAAYASGRSTNPSFWSKGPHTAKFVAEFLRNIVNNNNDDRLLRVGYFNLTQMGNAKYSQNATLGDDRSSHFVNADSPDTIIQWQTPLNMDLVDDIYTGYRIKKVHLELEIQNDRSGPNGILFFYKVFYPQEWHHHSFFLDRVYSATVPSGDTAQMDDEYMLLSKLQGMKMIRIGPNTANGYPNVGHVVIDVDVDKMRDIAISGGMEDESWADKTAITLFSSTTAPTKEASEPFIGFWMMNEERAPQVLDDVYIHGKVLYTVHLEDMIGAEQYEDDDPTA